PFPEGPDGRDGRPYAVRAGQAGLWEPPGTVGRSQRGGVSDRRRTGLRWCNRPSGVSLVVDQRSISAGVNSAGTCFSSPAGTWPQLGERRRREPALAEGARPVALREHVGLADQPAQGLQLPRLAEVEVGGELAVAGIQLLVLDDRQMRGRDLQDVGAVLGEGA